MILSDHQRGILIVVLGVLIVSFDALLVRLAGVSGWDVAFWRGLFTSISMLLASAISGEGLQVPRSFRRPLVAVALFSAFSSTGLVLAFTLTKASNAVVILSAAPLFTAMIARWLIGEQSRPRTWVAIALCMTGVIYVMAGSVGSGSFVGDLLALLATVLIGFYFALYRKYPTLSRLQAIGLGGVVMALVSFPLAAPLSLPSMSYLWLAIMGLVQMPLAMFMITSGTRRLPAAEVSLFLLLETLCAPIWVWLVFGETPPEATWAGGALIVITLIVHTWLGMRERARG